MGRNYTDKVLVDDERSGAYRMQRTYDGCNAKGERLVLEFTKGINPHTKGCLPKLWLKEGFTDHELESWWIVSTYVYQGKDCYGRYNPTVKHSQGWPSSVLDFDWVLEATQENLEKLAREVERRMFNAEGEAGRNVA